MPGCGKLGWGGGGAGRADAATGAMPANPLSPALTAAAGFGGGACGGLAACAGLAVCGGGGGVICMGFAAGRAVVTGCACQTWPHFEQRTFRPSGGKTALVS
jgi:hypothetical protein